MYSVLGQLFKGKGMKKIMILNGSPLAKGSCSSLAQSLSEELSHSDTKGETIFLQDLSIAHCLGCQKCVEDGTCVIDDDMKGLYEKIVEADGFVFITPIFWFNMSAQLKTFMDRCFALHNNKAAFEKKKFALMMSYGDVDVEDSGAANVVSCLESFAQFFHSELLEPIHSPSFKAEELEKNSDLLNEIKSLAGKLA